MASGWRQVRWDERQQKRWEGVPWLLAMVSALPFSGVFDIRRICKHIKSAQTGRAGGSSCHPQPRRPNRPPNRPSAGTKTIIKHSPCTHPRTSRWCPDQCQSQCPASPAPAGCRQARVIKALVAVRQTSSVGVGVGGGCKGGRQTRSLPCERSHGPPALAGSWSVMAGDSERRQWAG